MRHRSALRIVMPIAMLLLATACPKGEPCEMESYVTHCDSKSGWSYCANKDHSGFTKLWPTIVRMPCTQNTECVEEPGPRVACVAAPAERCEVEDALRCVDGLSQRCWGLGADPEAPLYWHFIGLSCES